MKIAVIFGGASAERDVSIASGTQVLKALKMKGHEVLAIDSANGIVTGKELDNLLNQEKLKIQKTPPDQKTLPRLKKQTARALTSIPELHAVDLAFLTLHGGEGEDGTIQAFFDVLNIPYTGSSHKGSALAMDKDLSKHLFRAAGVPTADWVLLKSHEITQTELEASFDYPLIVKANKQGSSVGLYVAKSWEEVQHAITNTLQFDDEVLIESYIPGKEYTVGILKNEALAVGEIIPQNSDLFDYESKYQADGAQEVFPAALSNELTKEAQRLALLAHQSLKLRDFSRVDFRLDEEGNFWCLEVNTLPGMTTRSLLPQSASSTGIPFPDFCERICQVAIERNQ